MLLKLAAIFRTFKIYHFYCGLHALCLFMHSIDAFGEQRFAIVSIVCSQRNAARVAFLLICCQNVCPRVNRGCFQPAAFFQIQLNRRPASPRLDFLFECVSGVCQVEVVQSRRRTNQPNKPVISNPTASFLGFIHVSSKRFR